MRVVIAGGLLGAVARCGGPVVPALLESLAYRGSVLGKLFLDALELLFQFLDAFRGGRLAT